MPSTLLQKSAIAASALALGFGLAACGGSSDNTTDTATPDSAQSIAVPGGDQGDSVTTKSLPSDWPTDVPAPANTTTQGAATVKGTSTATFTGTGDAEDAAQAYGQVLQANGWTRDAQASLNTKTMSKWDKGSRSLTVIAAATDSGNYGIVVGVTTN